MKARHEFKSGAEYTSYLRHYFSSRFACAIIQSPEQMKTLSGKWQHDGASMEQVVADKALQFTNALIEKL